MSYAYDNEDFSRYYDEFVAKHIPTDVYWTSTVKDVYIEIIKRTIMQDSIVVELGCGTGENLFYFREYFKNLNMKFIGIDHSEMMLKRAREKLNDETKHSIEFIHENLTNFARLFPEQSIDCILLPAGTFHHLITNLEREQFIKNIQQTLRSQTGLFALYLMPDSFIRIETIAEPNNQDKFQLISSENRQENDQEWICKSTFQFDIPPKINLSWDLRTCSITNLIDFFLFNDFQLVSVCLNGQDLENVNETIRSSLNNLSTPVILVFRTIKNTN